VLPADGQFFVEVFEVATGSKRLAIRGEFHRIDATSVWQETAWVAGRYLVLPFHTEMQAFAICDPGRAQ